MHQATQENKSKPRINRFDVKRTAVGPQSLIVVFRQLIWLDSLLWGTIGV